MAVDSAWALFDGGGSSSDSDEDVPGGGRASGPGAVPSRRPPSNGVLAFHPGTEEALLSRVELAVKDLSGDDSRPDAAIAAADRYCRSVHWMMLVGDEKGAILDDQVKAVVEAAPDGTPVHIVELGSYVGYSAVRIGRWLRPGDRLVTVDVDDNAVRWTQRMVELAGLADLVTVVHGAAKDVLPLVSGASDDVGSHKPFDLAFIDHAKELYASDLQHLLDTKCLKPGSVVVADNVLSFGMPLDDYSTLVRDTTLFASSILHKTKIEYPNEDDSGEGDTDAQVDGVEVSVVCDSYDSSGR